MVDCKVLFPAPITHRKDVDIPKFPGGVFCWNFKSVGASNGSLILGIDNRASSEYGREEVRVYVDVEIASSIPIRMELYTLDPLVPTLVVPAGEVRTVDVQSFLEGRGLDFTHCTGIGISLESAGGATRTKVHIFASFNGELEWIGGVY